MKLIRSIRSYVCLGRLMKVAKYWRMSDMAFLSRVLRWFDRQPPGMQMVVLGQLSESEFFAFAGQGDTEHPSWKVLRVEQIPPPREDVRLVARVDWNEITEALASGFAVSLFVAGHDIGLLVDMIQNRLGHNLVIRIPEPGLVCFFAPSALEPLTNGDVSQGNTSTT